MNTYKTIAVLGGGGRTGKFVVEKLINDGYTVNVLLRDPAPFLAEFADKTSNITIVQGDALDASKVAKLLDESDAVISTIGQRKDEPLVCALATESILAEMAARGIDRYVAVSGFNIDTPDDEKSQATREASDWMNTNFPEASQDKQKVYQLLSESQVSWTLVRLPLIEYHAFPGRIKVSLTDIPGEKIGAGDIAVFLGAQLNNSEFVRKAPFISN